MSDDDWGDTGGGGDDTWTDEADTKSATMADDDGWGSGGDEFDNDDNMTGMGGDGADTGNAPIDVQIANLFYEAEDVMRTRPQEALQKFEQILPLVQKHTSSQSIDSVLQSLSPDSRQSYVQSMVHIVTLQYKLQQYDRMLEQYKQLLSYVPHMTRNECTDSIDSVLNIVSTSANTDIQFLTQVYTTTSNTLSQMDDTQRIVFNIDMKLCKLYVDSKQYNAAVELLSRLHKSCQVTNERGELVDDKADKGSELLEVYALEIRLSFAQHNVSHMRALYDATKDLSAAVKDPRSQSVIRECWGMMHAHDRQWQKAYAEFYSAFQAYQEVGQRDKSKQCLQYVVVANLLAGGLQNPFDAREAKVYQNDADIQAIGALRTAYEKVDVVGFSNALKDVEQTGDAFILSNLDSMIVDFRSRAVVSMIRPYRQVALQVIAQQLNVSTADIEKIVVRLIVDGDITGSVDQSGGVLHIKQTDQQTTQRYTAQSQWCKAISTLSHNATQTQLQLTY